jgi:hypothetical protein
MVARLCVVFSCFLVACLGSCGGGGNGTADAAVAGGGLSAGNTGGATATGGASSPATSGGRQVVSLPDAGTPEADGPVVLPPECVSGTSLVCPCLSGRPGVKVCTEEGRFSTCVCAQPTPDAATPDAATPDAVTPDAATPDTATGPTTGDTVTFKQGLAIGVMTGYGWPNWGLVGDVVTDPACLGGVTSSSPCTLTAPWNSPTALCVSGTIAALATIPTQPDYNGNWGIEIGVYASTDGAAIGMPYASINVSLSGTSTNVLRVVVHRKGDPLTTQYCAAYTGSAILFASFNTACWNGGGTALLPADVPNINWVAVEIPSSTTAITVDNLCLKSITFN